MEDDQFYDRLEQASRLLTREPGAQLPGRPEVERAEAILRELENQLATADYKERQAALDAVYARLGRLANLIDPADQ